MNNNNYVVQTDPNFINELVISGLNQPINAVTLPDGKLLLLERPGVIKILDPQAKKPVASNYLKLSNVNEKGQKGLLSIALDPDFETNGYFYVYYNYDASSKNNGRFRISRFRHDVDRAYANEETLVWEANENIFGDRHYGGALGFGPDGYLYLATGENSDNPSSAQDLTHSRGKVIRIDPSAVDGPGGEWKRGGNNDHLIPDDNPYIDGPGGKLDEIWAYGLRNPFTGGWDVPSGRFFMADVGGDVQATAKEEINVVTVNDARANFGWPNVEGASADPTDKDPLFAYAHTGTAPNGGAAISGPVYRGNQFPSKFSGAYFFADYVQGWIRYLKFDSQGNVIDANPSTNKIDAFNFDNSIGGLVSLIQGPEGSLYYTDFFTGELRRIRYNADSNLPPIITQANANIKSGSTPFTVNFTGDATDPEDDTLKYVWDFGDGTTRNGSNATHTYNTNGSYSATLTVSDPTNSTRSEPINLVVGSAPEATILFPNNNKLFRAGETINIRGVATDDRPLSDDSYEWDVRFIHNAHFHPEITDKKGSSFPFTIETTGHDFSDNTGFEITLTVTDSEGLKDTEVISIYPEKVDLGFDTNIPGGITYTLDGVPRTGPFVHDTLINFEHTITAPQSVANGGELYLFERWSNGATTPTQTLTVPDSDQTFTAIYVNSGTAPRVEDGLRALYTFDEGQGNQILDVSGVGQPLNLEIDDPSDVTWGTGVLAVNDSTLISSLIPARKVTDAIKATNEITIEAWIAPDNLNQIGPARIVTLSKNGGKRNFTLGQGAFQSQTGDFSNVRLRTTQTTDNGTPSVSAGGLGTDLAHVVYTRKANGAARVYHDGVIVTSETVPGNLSNWNDNYQLALANELTRDRPWLGTFDLVAIYDQALTEAEILQNYKAGANDKPKNRSPIAVADFLSTTEDTALNIAGASLLSNDDLGDTPSAISAIDSNSKQDGTIKTNQNGSYTYTPAADFVGIDTFSYQITDADGESSTATVTVDVEAHDHNDHDHDPDADNVIGEVGRIKGLGLTPQTITLQKDYIDPVVIVQPASSKEADPVAVRLYDIDNNQFTVALQEPSNLKDGSHTGESLTYMVLEAGVWTLEDGTKLEVGTFNRKNLVSQGTWKSVSFDSEFDAAPVVLSQVQTRNDATFVRTRQRQASANGVQIGLEEQESLKKSGHATEKIAYVAIEASTGSWWNGIGYESNRTGDTVTHRWHTLNFADSLAQPEILASVSSYDGSDPVGLRYDDLTANNVKLRLEEDTSADAETNHTTESIDYIAFGGTGLLTGKATDETDGSGGGDNDDGGSNPGSDKDMAVFGTIQNLQHTTQTIDYGDIDGDGSIDIEFKNPVVIAMPASFNGSQSAVPRVFNVTGSRFDIKIQEPDFLPVDKGGTNPGGHTRETVHYLVAEAGTWQLDDGSLFAAGTFNTDQVAENGFESIAFDAPFAQTPAVLSQTQTNNENSFVFTRERNLSSTGFDVALQEEAKNRGSGHANETVGYIAFDPLAPSGAGSWSGHDYLTGRTGKRFDHSIDSNNTIKFGSVFDRTPTLLAQIDTYEDADPAFLRYQNLGQSRVQLSVQEDQTLTRGTAHGLESVSYLVIAGNGILSASEVII